MGNVYYIVAIETIDFRVIMSITILNFVFLFAGRYGLIPTSTKFMGADLKLYTRDTKLKTSDPAGFTAVDVAAICSLAHIFGVGAYLGTVGSTLNASSVYQFLIIEI